MALITEMVGTGLVVYQGENTLAAAGSATAAALDAAAVRADRLLADAAAISAHADALQVEITLGGLKAQQTPLATSFERYLDTVSGNDANNGLTPNTPKKTAAAVVAMGSITAGVAIGIARGSQISTTVLTGNNVRIGSYGALGTPPPVFDPSILLSPGGWTADGTYAAMWNQAASGGYVDADLKNIGNVVWLDQSTGKYVVLKQYASKAALNAVASGVYVSGWNTTTLTVSLKPGTFGDPSTSAQEYRVTNGYALRILGDYQTVSDVTVQNAAEQNGCIDLPGNFATVRRIGSLNGSRHNALFARNSVVEDSYFGGGDNQLESGQGPNGVVFYAVDFAGATFTVRRCTFEDSDGNGMQPIYSHDTTPTGIPLPALIEDCTFIGCNIPCETGVTGGFLNLVRPVFRTSTRGRVCALIGNRSMACQFATGTVNALTDQGLGGATLSFYDSVLTMPSLGNAASQSAAYWPGASGGPTVNIIRGTYRVGPEVLNYSGHENAFVSLNSGTLRIDGATIKTIGSFHAAGMKYGWDLGYAAGTVTKTGGNNRWPYGAKFARNGTTYANLAAAQAAGFEAGSTSEPVPTATVVGDFSAVANGNLEGVAGWTKLMGGAGAFTVTSNKVGAAFAANSAYKKGDVPVSGSYLRVKLEGLTEWLYATHKMNAAGDYWLGVGVDTTGKPVLKYINTVAVQATIISSPTAAVVGDILTVITMVLDPVTGRMGNWLYVNDALVASGEYTNTVIAAATGVGFASIGYNTAGLGFSTLSAGPLA